MIVKLSNVYLESEDEDTDQICFSCFPGENQMRCVNKLDASLRRP